MDQKILVIGTGALACLFAARLAKRGYHISMTGTWTDALDAFQTKGVGLIETGCFEPVFYPVEILEPGKSYQTHDHVLLLTKAYQVRDALRRVMQNLAEGAVILSLQNGLTVGKELKEFRNRFEVIQGITTCGAEVVQPGVAKHNGGWLIRMDQKESVHGMAGFLKEAGFTVSLEENINQAIWEKAVLNSAANPIGALTGKRNGELLDLPGVMHIMDDLIQEACNVAAGEGFAIRGDEMKERLRQVMRETVSNRCSMLQDVLNGRRTEIEDINGEIIELAIARGIDIPVQTTITNLIRSL